jgi:hypothetical protein
MSVFDDCVWVVYRTDNKTKEAFEQGDQAKMKAEGIVGNQSAARPSPDIFLYGPGDGTTTVTVRQIPRAWAPKPGDPPSEWVK